MTNFIKLTELHKTSEGEVQEREIYVNPDHIQHFDMFYAHNFHTYVTAINWGAGVFNDTYVKETPEQIINLTK